MIDPLLISFVWNAVASGLIGNVAYDGIKTILGKGFERLTSYAAENKKHEFEIALHSILETNENIEKQLLQLRDSISANTQKQSHSGTGDNIGRDSIVNPSYIDNNNISGNGNIFAPQGHIEMHNEQYSMTFLEINGDNIQQKDLQKILRNYTRSKSEIPSGDEVAYQMGLLVQEFENKFNTITNGEPGDMGKQYNSTREPLDKLFDMWLPQANLVLRNADEVRDGLLKLNWARNKYGFALGSFADIKHMISGFDGVQNLVPVPRHIQESMLESLKSMESNKQEVGVFAKELLKLLRENI
jgi:hypothetical protein